MSHNWADIMDDLDKKPVVVPPKEPPPKDLK